MITVEMEDEKGIFAAHMITEDVHEGCQRIFHLSHGPVDFGQDAAVVHVLGVYPS